MRIVKHKMSNCQIPENQNLFQNSESGPDLHEEHLLDDLWLRDAAKHMNESECFQNAELKKHLENDLYYKTNANNLTEIEKSNVKNTSEFLQNYHETTGCPIDVLSSIFSMKKSLNK